MVVDRVYTIRQHIRLLCVNEDENDGSFTNTIHAFVEDELVNKVEIGQIIEVIGLVGRHLPTLDGETLILIFLVSPLKHHI